jgi:hypothetical protein
MLPLIRSGDQVFLAGGTGAFGAVRQVRPGWIVINVEGGGDFPIALDAVAAVTAGKVTLRWDRLQNDLQRAIAHALDVEDFPPEGEGEVEIVPPFGDDEVEPEP